MALVMHRLLEKELGKAGPNLSVERITEAPLEARLQELVLGEKRNLLRQKQLRMGLRSSR